MPYSRHFVLALAAVLILTAAPLAAAEPLFAAQKNVIQKYWDGFSDYWGGSFKSQSMISMVVLGTGAVGLFIITRGKWKK